MLSPRTITPLAQALLTSRSAVLAAALAGASLAGLALAVPHGAAAAAVPSIGMSILAEPAYPPIAMSGDLAAFPNSAGVEVYERRGDSWSRQAVIPPPADMKRGGFGLAVALADGTLAVSTGWSVYIFVHSGRNWHRVARFDAPVQSDETIGFFGYSLALSQDALIVGKPDFSRPNAKGVAFAYGRDASGDWLLEAELGERPFPNPSYGAAVAISGTSAFVSGASVGFVDVYERLQHHWRLVAQLTGGFLFDPGFGFALAASGSTVVVGGDPQQVFVFVRARGQWVEQARLSTPRLNSGFGTAVAIDEDTIVVGGDQLDKTAYVYTRGPRAWGPAIELVPAGPTIDFGMSVAVSGHSALVAGFDIGPGLALAVWVVDGLDEP